MVIVYVISKSEYSSDLHERFHEHLCNLRWCSSIFQSEWKFAVFIALFCGAFEIRIEALRWSHSKIVNQISIVQ